MNLFLLEEATEAAETGSSSLIMQLVMIAIIVVIFYFLLIRPQKKREKEAQNMRNALDIGDEITTVGGVVGIVVSVKEDTVVIETGTDRNKVRIKRWAIQSNDTPREKDESK